MENQEQIILKAHPHWVGYLGYYFFGILLPIAGILLFAVLGKFIFLWPAVLAGLLAIGLGELTRRAETFYLLDSGVAKEYKMLSTSRRFAEYHDIQNIEVNQSIWQNMFKTGNLNFDTSGTDKIEVSFHGVKNPFEIEKIVREKMKTG